MTGLEYLLAATFVAVGLVPLAMALRWERRLAAERRRRSASPSPDAGETSELEQAGR